MSNNLYRSKQLYLRVLTGIKKANLENKRLTFITLTTSDSTGLGLCDKDKMDLISRSWNILLTYFKQKFKKLEQITVITNEGNGVIHCLMSNLPFIYWKTIARIWNYIHGSQIIYLTKFRGNSKKISNYIMSQYLSNQNCVFRYKMSNNWICKNFSKYWKIIKKCSVDYSSTPTIMYGRYIYKIDFNFLKSNLVSWLKYYIKHNILLEYIPNSSNILKQSYL